MNSLVFGHTAYYMCRFLFHKLSTSVDESTSNNLSQQGFHGEIIGD